MEIIKEITKGNKILQHSRYVDDFGFEQDIFEIIETDEKGFHTHIPFWPPLTADNFDRDTDFKKSRFNFTNEDYYKMIN